MKKIKIFFAIGDECLISDKNEISNFVRNLNDVFEKNNVYFNLLADDTVEQIDENSIENSELFIIMFGKNISTKAEEEFDIAYKYFKDNKAPKIATYVKGVNDNKEKSALDFMNKLSEELGHYYSTYDNTDTIKLNLVLQLDNLGLDGTKIETKEDKIFINNEEIMTLQNIPMFVNSKQLGVLKDEYSTLEKRVFELREQIASAENNSEKVNIDELEANLNIEIEKLEKVKKSISEVKRDMIELEASFIKSSNEGGLSKRQVYAKKCLEEGDLEEAKSALDFNDIKEDADRALDIKEKEDRNIEVLRNELKERIKALEAQKPTLEDYKEMEKCYNEIIDLDKESGNTFNLLNTYIDLTKLALKMLDKDKMERYLDKTKNALLQLGSSREKGYYELQFVVCELEESVNRTTGYSVFNRDSEKEENRIEDKIKVLEKLVELEDDQNRIIQYSIILIKEYGNIATKYSKQGKHQKACEHIEKAVQLSEKMYNGKNKFLFEMSLQDSYNTAVALYQLWGKEDSSKRKYAIDYMAKNVKIAEEMFENNPKLYRGRLAVVYNNYASICNNAEPPMYDEVEKYYKKAIENMSKSIQERDIPISYTNLSSFRKNFGAYYEKRGDIKKAEEMFLERVNACENYLLQKKDDKLFIGYGMAYKYIVEEFYEKRKEIKKAEKFYKSIEKRWKKLTKSYDNYVWEYLHIILDKAAFYNRIGKVRKAEKDYEKVNKILNSFEREKRENLMVRGLKEKINEGEIQKSLRNNDKRSLIKLYIENGKMELAIRNYAGTKEYFEKVLNITKEDAKLKEEFSDEIRKLRDVLDEIEE